jgi:hypothetical protein
VPRWTSREGMQSSSQRGWPARSAPAEPPSRRRPPAAVPTTPCDGSIQLSLHCYRCSPGRPAKEMPQASRSLGSRSSSRQSHSLSRRGRHRMWPTEHVFVPDVEGLPSAPNLRRISVRQGHLGSGAVDEECQNPRPTAEAVAAVVSCSRFGTFCTGRVPDTCPGNVYTSTRRQGLQPLQMSVRVGAPRSSVRRQLCDSGPL